MIHFRYLALLFFIFIFYNAQASERHFPMGVTEISIPKVRGVRSNQLENIAPIVKRSIQQGYYPGAVILAGHNGQIIYRGVFGSRRIIPDVQPMRRDTIFDLASLTKVVVTTTAIMQLVEKGKLDLDSSVGHYWPAFVQNGKQSVTVRQLLTHTSGFPAGLTFHHSGDQSHAVLGGPSDGVRAVEGERLINLPGTTFRYSDVNFAALGHLIELLSGERLDDYARGHIFKPLGMNRTFFLPPLQYKDDIAPTELVNGKLRWGIVHDDAAELIGGVGGMAGLFSDADDLGTFAQCLVDGGKTPSSYIRSSQYILGPLSVLKMSSPQTPASLSDTHGLGWDVDSRYSNRGILFPLNSFGHTGYTGTSIWIDPATKTWLVILTSRTHPTPAPTNALLQDRRAIANIIAGSITDVPMKIRNTGKGELARAFPQL